MSHRTSAGNRAPSSKVGRNKWKCDKYRVENRKAKNAVLRAQRHANVLLKAAVARDINRVTSVIVN